MFVFFFFIFYSRKVNIKVEDDFLDEIYDLLVGVLINEIKYTQIGQNNLKNKKIYLFGFSKWKRNFIKPFFPDSELIFVEDYKKVPKNVSLYMFGV